MTFYDPVFLERQVSDHTEYMLFTEQQREPHLFPEKIFSIAEGIELRDLQMKTAVAKQTVKENGYKTVITKFVKCFLTLAAHKDSSTAK